MIPAESIPRATRKTRHIFENWIYNIQKRPDYLTGSNWPVCGIYLDDGSDYFRVENNVIENVGDHPWYMGDTSGLGGLRYQGSQCQYRKP